MSEALPYSRIITVGLSKFSEPSIIALNNALFDLISVSNTDRYSEIGQ